jgi:hypothetical protein
LLAVVVELFEFFEKNPARRLRINQSSAIPMASLVNLPVNFRAPQLVPVAAPAKTHWIVVTNSTAFSEPLPSSFGDERMPFYNEFLLRIQQDSLFHDPLLLEPSVICRPKESLSAEAALARL